MDNSCAVLETLTSFDGYVTNLRNVTSNNITVEEMQPCRTEICMALYSIGNADVNGIGIVVGYFIEFGMAFILSVTTIHLLHRGNEHKIGICRSITRAFADSAIALTLSVELASAIMLIKKSFGLGAHEFGGFTVRIVWIVAALVMLPIVDYCWQDLGDGRSEVRLCAIALGFMLFFVAFICKMISTYSKGQIGGDGDAVMSLEEAYQVQHLCLGPEPKLTAAGSIIVELFFIGASLWICCNVVFALLERCLNGSASHSYLRVWRGCVRSLKDQKSGRCIAAVALVFWSTPLFWGMMTLRSRQKQFAESLGEQNGNDTWSFGQIIAVVVYLPALNELLFQYLDRGLIGQNTIAANSGIVTSKDVELLA